MGWIFRARTRAIHPDKLINLHMQSKNTVSGDDTPVTTTGPWRVRRGSGDVDLR
jgi:hypothetical protein